MNKASRHIVILGNGIAGVTCARFVRKYNAGAAITLVSGESSHFFSRTALMYIYMGHMKWKHTKPYEDWFWDKNRISLLYAWVNGVDFEQKILKLENGASLSFDTLVLATGSKPATLNWQGVDLPGVQGLYSLQDLSLLEENTRKAKKAMIVGGGLIGVELAEMLRSRQIEVTMMVRETHLWGNVLPAEEGKLLEAHLRQHGVEVLVNQNLEKINAGPNGRACEVVGVDGTRLPCDFVGVAIGVVPNVGFLRGQKDTSSDQKTLEIDRGILVNEHFETSIPDVYAIGDCAQFLVAPAAGRNTIEQVWYTGRMHGERLGQNLGEDLHHPYTPGLWFNSAKFFDIEYQVYGSVPNVAVDGQTSFYWQHTSRPIALRIAYRVDSRAVLGISSLGWRLDHVWLDEAIQAGWTIDDVLENLEQLSFNPEFFPNYYDEVLEHYRKETGLVLKRTKKSWLRKVLGG